MASSLLDFCKGTDWKSTERLDLHGDRKEATSRFWQYGKIRQVFDNGDVGGEQRGVNWPAPVVRVVDVERVDADQSGTVYGKGIIPV